MPCRIEAAACSALTPSGTATASFERHRDPLGIRARRRRPGDAIALGELARRAHHGPRALRADDQRQRRPPVHRAAALALVDVAEVDADRLDADDEVALGLGDVREVHDLRAALAGDLDRAHGSILAMDEFVRAATSGRRARAEALWRETGDPWARLAHGDGFDGDPNAPGGPLDWAPLLYVTHSVFANAQLARELLRRGADPNATFTNEYGEMSALYGAAGRAHDPELTRVLLEAGANPDDGESVYHSTEARVPRMPARAARARRDGRADHARPRARRRAPRARAAPARRRRRRRASCCRTPSAAAAGRRRSGSWCKAAPSSSTAAARCGASPSGCAPPTSTRSCATATTSPPRWRSWARAPRSTSTTSRSPPSPAASGRRSSRASSTATSRRRSCAPRRCRWSSSSTAPTSRA